MLSILRKINSKYYVFVSIFHSKSDAFFGWKIHSLDSFAESLIQEQEKLIWMGIIQTSKDKALPVTDSTKAQVKWKEPIEIDSNPKENQKTFEGPSGSRKKKQFEKKMCPYCMRGFHLEYSCMKAYLIFFSILFII